MTVQSDNQHDIVPLRSDNITATSDAETASLNLCGNALVFAQGVHSAYTADVVTDAHTWDTPAAYPATPAATPGRVDPRPAAIAVKARRDKRDTEVIWG